MHRCCRVEWWIACALLAQTVAWSVGPAANQAVADEGTNPGTAAKARGERRPPPNLYAPTLGGWQMWTDEFVYRDWRIQRHCETSHCRLLDGDNFRCAWGTYDDCRRKFEELRTSRKLPPLGPKVVIALHGLGNTRTVMTRLADYLRKDGDYEVLLVSYASTRADIETHAQSLAKVVEGLEDVREINFVAHSLGNLVLRHYLYDQTDAAQGLRPDPRIKRIVMLGPPNQGARLASLLRPLPLFTQIVGPSGQQLAEGWEEVSKQLATPTCEFGILAGGRGDDKGLNPWVSGDDDLIVRVEETQLAGARDFRVLPCYHRQLLGDPTVHEYVQRFLRRGYFESEAARQPLVDLPAARPADPAKR